ncbi:MAG: hypothetical protein CMI18_06805 [Opitutaceae bacterium]|nr:hypothetical protein [Opitutaceae bacterium]
MLGLLMFKIFRTFKIFITNHRHHWFSLQKILSYSVIATAKIGEISIRKSLTARKMLKNPENLPRITYEVDKC